MLLCAYEKEAHFRKDRRIWNKTKFVPAYWFYREKLKSSVEGVKHTASGSILAPSEGDKANITAQIKNSKILKNNYKPHHRT